MNNQVIIQKTNLHPLRLAFKKLPEPVKQWLTSEQVTSVVISINNKLNLVGDLVSIVPNYLILRLVVKDLNPENFTQELNNQLDLSPEQVRAVTEEIVQKILKPIEIPLGLNLNKMLQYSDFVSPTDLRSPQIETPSPKPPMPPRSAAPMPSRPLTPPMPRIFKIPDVGHFNIQEIQKEIAEEPRKVNYGEQKTPL